MVVGGSYNDGRGMMDRNSMWSWQQGRYRVMVNIMDSMMDGSYSCSK